MGEQEEEEGVDSMPKEEEAAEEVEEATGEKDDEGGRFRPNSSCQIIKYLIIWITTLPLEGNLNCLDNPYYHPKNISNAVIR